MTRILMASNDQTFSPALSHAYHARGLDVVAGIPNLDPAFGRADVVHLHWPEELVGWGQNHRDPERTARALDLLDRWRQRAVLVATVHNLVPHGTDRLDGPEAAYFNAFYRRVDLICHYSDYSRARFRETYPDLDDARHIVVPLNSYSHLLPLAQGRAAARGALGLSADEPVFAVCGAIRHGEEMVLVRDAWRAFRRPDARLLLATRPNWASIPQSRRLAAKLRHGLWLRDGRIRRLPPGPSDAALVQILEAADALLIPRLGHHLNSGLIPLALTFGTAVVAPDRGANREIVPLPANELWAPTGPRAFAEAMARQADKDSAAVRAANLAHRDTIGWARILDLIWPRLAAIGQARGIGAFTA
jgi:glycosyltransferase involved in cell wall biosynthesis